jgi:hypothetical protein
MGDYDAAAWLSACAAGIWDNPDRGKLPLCWAFNPNLTARVPQAFKYFYKTRTDKDHLIFGDSGAGYLNPSLLIPPRRHSDLPSGLDVWVKHNLKYCDKYGLSITGMLIDGNAAPLRKQVEKVLPLFSPDGVMCNDEFLPAPCPAGTAKMIDDKTPIIRVSGFIPPHEVNTTDGINKKADAIYDVLPSCDKTGEPVFLTFRSILVKPSEIVQLTNRLNKIYPDANYEVVDPYTFFELLREYLKQQE